jgi:DNA invertase Pin-like site-specific DNA recombinase
MTGFYGALGKRTEKRRLRKSGAKKEALEYMRAGDTPVVWKFFRLARSLSWITSTANDLREREIELKVITRKTDTGTPEGRLFFRMNAAFDQFQREIIVENTKAELKAARENGRIGGRPRSVSEEKRRRIGSMIRDEAAYPFITNIIRASGVGKTTFCKYFPPEEIRKLRTAGA